MKRVLYLFPIVLFFVSCNKNEEVALTFQDVIAQGGGFEPVTTSEQPVDEETSVEIINGEVWNCTTITYDAMAPGGGDNGFPLFNPNASVIYPGSLLQGNSLRKATPDVIAVERAGGTISYDLVNGNISSYFSVEKVAKSSIQNAMNQIIANSPADLPANFVFNYSQVQSERALALKLGIDYETAFTSISGNFGFSSGSNLNRIVVELNQSFYTMSFDIPTSLDGLFAPSVTPADLAKYVYEGNPATYISDVTYGRIYYMLIESTSSYTEMEAAVSASFSGVVASTNADISGHSLNTLSNLIIKVMAFGGEATTTMLTIGESNLNNLVTLLAQSTTIATGVPISYVVRSVYDNRIVSVQLATQYDVTNCEPAQPGTFNFLNAQNLGLPIPAPVKVMMGDVNGDGNQDIIYNHVSAGSNETVVAFSNGDGTFTMGTPTSHSVTPADGWSQYVVKVGDFNNDGRDDLAWSRVITTNTTYVSLSNGDGTFEEMPMFTKGGSGWGTDYRFEVGDIDGEDGDDLIWNELIGRNRTYVTFSNGDGTFGIDNFEPTAGTFQDHPSGGWNNTNYVFSVADIDGDERDDLIWHTKGITGNLGHGIWVAESVRDQPGNVFDFKDGFRRSSQGWENYKVVIGNIDGNVGADLVWINSNRTSDIAIHRDLSRAGNPPLEAGPLQYYSDNNESTNYSTYDMRQALMDVNGDGRKDLLINRMDVVNQSAIGLGRNDGTFDFSRIDQVHPINDQWGQFEILVGDINGDLREDVIYVNADASNTVYVGLSRGSEQ
jgi:hypothetical protein